MFEYPGTPGEQCFGCSLEAKPILDTGSVERAYRIESQFVLMLHPYAFI
jgi:hypothetical protein